MLEDIGIRFAPGERITHHEYGQGVVLDPVRDEQRLALFAQAVEPALQRELQHKGAANGGGSYSAELIAYAEINSGGRG